jgi:hypothetical protein
MGNQLHDVARRIEAITGKRITVVEVEDIVSCVRIGQELCPGTQPLIRRLKTVARSQKSEVVEGSIECRWPSPAERPQQGLVRRVAS